MPDISELKARIIQARQALMNALPQIATQNTIVAKALAERKIREAGFGAVYSNHLVPAWHFLGLEKSKAGEAFIKKKEAYDEKNAKIVDGKKVYASDAGITWAQLRQAEGLPVDHVDLSFTNKMWAGFVPQQPFMQGNVMVCPLAGNSIEVINKLSSNYKHYGDFIGKVLGPPEIEIMTTAIAEQVKNLINNTFKK